MFRDKNGVHAVPTFKLDGTTLIFDRKRNTQVMRIDGVLVLPVGAEIELTEPNVSARVTGVRLAAGVRGTGESKDHPALVCIDVDVPAEWWDEKE